MSFAAQEILESMPEAAVKSGDNKFVIAKVELTPCIT